MPTASDDQPTLAKLGAMGHHGSDDYETCNEPKHWEYVPGRMSAEEADASFDARFERDQRMERWDRR